MEGDAISFGQIQHSNSHLSLQESHFQWSRWNRVRLEADRESLQGNFVPASPLSLSNWCLSWQLFLNDSSNTPVAVFHRRRLGIFRERRPASLEIFPEGQRIIDLILVTFIYVEKLRDEREKAAQSSHGGGP